MIHPRAPRWMHRAYAHLTGHYWYPCPLCGRRFGGHEWGGQRVRIDAYPGAVTAICPSCGRAGYGDTA